MCACVPQMRVEISAPHGQLTLATVAGLSFDTGDGVADEFSVFTGHPGDINTALRGVIYRGDSDWNTRGIVWNTVTITASNSHAELGGIEPVAVYAEQNFW